MNTVNQSLNAITKGSLVIGIGTLLSIFLSFIIRIFIVRNISVSEMGILSLTLTIINIVVGFASIGINLGVTRFVAHHRSLNDQKSVKGTVLAGLKIVLITSTLCPIALYFGQKFMATAFGNPSVSQFVAIYSLTIPSLLLIQLAISILRGYNRIREKVIFQDILQNITLLLGLLLAHIAGFSLLDIIVAYLVSANTTALIFFLFFHKTITKFFLNLKHNSMVKPLLFFSFPLFIRQILIKILGWSDILILGIFLEESFVGIYNVTFSTASHIKFFFTAMLFLFLPTATQLASLNDFESLKIVYRIVTKWVLALTTPLFIFLILYPSDVMNLLYGPEYSNISTTFRLICTGIFVNILLGPNANTLACCGKTKYLMYTSFLSAALNLGLNFILIPKLGIIGGAISSFIALITINTLNSLYLYKVYKICSINIKMITTLCAVIFFALIAHTTLSTILHTRLILLSIMLPFLYVSYFTSLILTKNIDSEDINFIETIERKTKINLCFIKKPLKKCASNPLKQK